jgi:hypothetical protein
MLARSRFGRIKECDILLSKLASEGHPRLHAFYEWINPITDEGSGAYPFRTGITAIRIALADILEKVKTVSPSSLSVQAIELQCSFLISLETYTHNILLTRMIKVCL